MDVDQTLARWKEIELGVGVTSAFGELPGLPKELPVALEQLAALLDEVSDQGILAWPLASGSTPVVLHACAKLLEKHLTVHRVLMVKTPVSYASLASQAKVEAGEA